jgi:hypothetical protein
LFHGTEIRHLVALIAGLVLTVGTHTVSQMTLTIGLHASKHFANICEFLLKSKRNTGKVACQVFKIIVETVLTDASEEKVIVDDTLNSRMGKKICGARLRCDRNAPIDGKPVGSGVCFVIVGVVVRLP